MKKSHKPITVLSLFDGISAGRLALERAGIRVKHYYRAEIDKSANQIAQTHYSEDTQLGDVRNWRDWNIDWSQIDLLIGGSPCQGFSFVGKQLAFEDPRSQLFFEFMNILNHIRSFNPKAHFLLENVRMRSQYIQVIDQHTGVSPVLINSALLSAQNRWRLYWCSWNVQPPTHDMGIELRDILESIPSENPATGAPVIVRKKSKTVRSSGRLSYDRHEWDSISNCHSRKFTALECERLQTFPDNWTKGVSETQRYKALGNSWTVEVIAYLFKQLPKES